MVENITRLPQEKSDAQASARCKGSFFPAIIGEKLKKSENYFFHFCEILCLHIYIYSIFQPFNNQDLMIMMMRNVELPRWPAVGRCVKGAVVQLG